MHLLIVLFVLIHVASSALVLWTPKPIYYPTLRPFTSDDYLQLLKDLNNPPVVAFQSDSFDEALQLQETVNNSNSVYLSNSGFDVSDHADVQEITEDALKDLNVLNKHSLVMLVVPETLSRTKRKVDNTTSAREEPFVIEPEPLLNGAVVYRYSIDKHDEVIVYSSQPPLLYIDDVTVNLGNASTTFIDVRESYFRLIARILTVKNRTIFIRFIFSMLGGNWYLNFVEVEINSVRYNLALTGSNNVTAPYHMSYHCEDQTVFTDVKTNISLVLYDLQAQPDAHNRRFSGAYNCIPFTTAPILSGLFVMLIMGIGLAIGLMALASIKTMDRFDNSKTKQLSITLFE